MTPEFRICAKEEARAAGGGPPMRMQTTTRAAQACDATGRSTLQRMFE